MFPPVTVICFGVTFRVAPPLLVAAAAPLVLAAVLLVLVAPVPPRAFRTDGPAPEILVFALNVDPPLLEGFPVFVFQPFL